MRSALTFRLAVAVAAGFGLLLAWSSVQPTVDLQAYYRQQLIDEGLAPQPANNTSDVPRVPVATPAPIASPLPTPTASATETPASPASGAMSVDCDASLAGVQASCSYPIGTPFSIQVQVNAPPSGGYYAFDTELSWSGPLSYLPTKAASDEALWPDCNLPLRSNDQTSLSFGCATFPALTEGSTFTGAVLQFQLQCQKDGATPLALAASRDAGPATEFVNDQGATVLPGLASATIVCGSGPPATPTPTVAPPSTPGPSPSPVPTTSPDAPAPPGTTVEQTISPAGGSITTSDGRVTIEFPPEAVSHPLKVRVTHRDATKLTPMPDHPFLTAWQFDAFATDGKMSQVKQFPASVTISVRYTDQDLLGRNPETLQLWTWDEKTNEWQRLPSEHVPNTGIVTTKINHFSLDVGTADPAVIQPAFLRAYQTNLQTGASQVSLPLDLPPGRSGLTPDLSLSYSSDRVNEMKSAMAQGSWLGVGWDLDVGSIRQEFPQVAGGTSRYFLDLNGMSDELVQDASTNPPTWRTRHNQFLRIQLQGSSCGPVQATPPAQIIAWPPTPPCSWIVTDKQGRKYYFGATPQGGDYTAARYYDFYYSDPNRDPGCAPNCYVGYKLFYYRWDLREVLDTHSNVLLYGYTQQKLDDQPSGAPCCQRWVFSSYLTQIAYDLNDQGLPNAVINFDLGYDYDNTLLGFPQLPLRNDSPHDFVLQTCHFYTPKAEETERLDAIEVWVNGQTARKYAFNYYTTSFTVDGNCNPQPTGSHQLNFMKQFGNDWNLPGTPAPLYTMNFSYQNRNIDYAGINPPNPSTYSRLFLTSTTNGFGGTASYDYSQRSPTLGWGREAVNSLILSDNVTGVATSTSYQYKTAPVYYQPPGGTDAEFRGFDWVRETREAGSNGTYTDHLFYTVGSNNTEDPRSGRERQTDVYKGDGTLWRRTLPVWQPMCLANCNTATESDFVKLASVDTYDGASTPQAHLRTEYDYDGYGNVLYERQLGSYSDQVADNVTSDDRTIYTPYVAPANPSDFNGPWIFVPTVRYVCTGSFSSSSNPGCATALAAATNYYYDGSPQDVFASMPTVGNLTAVERSDLQTTNQYSDVYYAYNSNGTKDGESVPTTTRASLRCAPIPNPCSPPYGNIPLGVSSTSWTYDPTLSVYPATVENSMNQFTALTWDPVKGTLTQRRDQDTSAITYHTTSFAYDQFGRLTDVGDDLTSLITHYDYLWTQSQSGGINSTLTKHYNNTGFTWESHCFDGFGREVQVRRSYKPDPSGQDSVVQTNYTSRGLVSYQTAPFQATSTGAYGGVCTSMFDVSAKSRTTYASYNPLDEADHAQTYDALENPPVTNRYLSHDGLTTITTDENNHPIKYLNDGQGRLAQVTEYMSGSPYSVTKYQYDALDDLTLVTDGQTAGYLSDPTKQGNVSRMRYDGMRRKVETWDADMGHWTYVYDVAGNLKQQQDARGTNVSMRYDPLNRVTTKCYVDWDSCNGNPQTYAKVTFGYDTYAAGDCSGNQATATGHLTQMTDQSNSTPPNNLNPTKWCYDLRGRQTKELRAIGTSPTATYEVDQNYDQVGDRLISTQYPDGEIATTSYDQTSGQPTQLSSSLGTYVSSATYDAAFRPLAEPLGTGQNMTSFTYNGRGWVKTIQTTRTGNPRIQDVAYAYDNVGNVQTMSDNVSPTETVAFGYDALNRLTSATGFNGGTTAGYAYDQIGNVTHIQEGNSNLYPRYGAQRKPHAAMVVDNNDPGTLASIVAAYDYDMNGNLIGAATASNGTGQAVTVDSDHDGCSNGNERRSDNDQTKCGSRDPANYWDYADTPTIGTGARDCKIRVDDVTNVVNHYRHDDAGGTAAVNRYTDPLTIPPADLTYPYHPAYDRAGPQAGQPGWKQAPPNGEIRVDDVTNVVNQYGHNNIRPDLSAGCNNDPTYLGNAVSIFPTKYTYDAENRLTKSENNCNVACVTVASYTYDGQGTLVQKTDSNGAKTDYVGGIFEKNLSTSVITKYYLFDGRRIAVRTAGTLKYLLADSLGSTTTVVNTSGATVGAEQRYFPFGSTRSGNVGTTTDKQFTGQQKEGSLYFMQSRFYDPTIGRFLQPDTIVPSAANPQSLNRYSYVLNDPLSYNDPTGHVPCPHVGVDLPCPSDEVLDYCLLGMGCTTVAPNIPWEWTARFVCEQYATCAPGEKDSFDAIGFVRQAALDTVVGFANDICITTSGRTCSGQHVSWLRKGLAFLNIATIVATVGTGGEALETGEGALEREMTAAAERAAAGRAMDDIVANTDTFRAFLAHNSPVGKIYSDEDALLIAAKLDQLHVNYDIHPPEGQWGYHIKVQDPKFANTHISVTKDFYNFWKSTH